MATTVEGRRLTEAHRKGQLAIANTLVAESRIVWSMLDPRAIDATRTEWLAVQLALTNARWLDSMDLSRAYAPAFQVAETKKPSTAPEVVLEFPTVAAATSLDVTGPVAVKTAMTTTTTLTAAYESAFALVAGAAMRLALDGGRDYLEESVRKNRNALGWHRVTDGKPCYFCAMLASRGGVYKRGSFKSSDARFTGGKHEKVHDGCGCGMEIAFFRQDFISDDAREWDALWTSSGAVKDSGKSAINTFRRAYEAL